MNNKISIVIATRKFSNNLHQTINSINKQIYLPKEIILVSNKKILQKINLNKKIILKKFLSNIKNQVFQRNIAIKNISKSCNIFLQLDDRIILDKRCLYELNESWNKSDATIVGIGLNQTNRLKNQGLFNKVINNFNLGGRVLPNGINIDYYNLKKNKKVMWLKGGLSSWRIKKNQKFKERKYPIKKWSVFEDVEFCLNIKKKEKLLVSHKAKINIIESNQKPNIRNLFFRGTAHTSSQKKLVQKYFKNMTYFFLTIPILIFFSLLISVFTLDISKFIYNLGRLRGFFL